MTSKVNKGHKSSYIIEKDDYNISFCLMHNFLKLFKNVNIMKTQIFDKMNYDLKGHPRSYFQDFSFFFLAHSFMNRF